MKLWIYITGLVLLSACQKDEVPGYSLEKDCAYFEMEKMEQTINFADVMLKKDNLPWYPGDEYQKDTIMVKVAVMGRAKDYDRELYFKTVLLEEQDSVHVGRVEVLEPHIIRANHIVDTIYVVYYRPEERQIEYAVGLTFDVEKSEFDSPTYEQGILKFRLRDRFTKPFNWDSFYINYLGEWSPDKHLFVRTVLNSTALPAANATPWLRMFYPRIKRAYDTYNAEHPESPYAFTIPVLE